MEPGYELGFDEIKLTNEDARNCQAVRWLEMEDAADKITINETDTEISLLAKRLSLYIG